jgi:hypothetical protein
MRQGEVLKLKEKKTRSKKRRTERSLEEITHTGLSEYKTNAWEKA